MYVNFTTNLMQSLHHLHQQYTCYWNWAGMMEQSVAKLVYCESTNATAIQKVQNHFQFSKSSSKMNTFTESQYQVSMATLGSMYMSSRGWQGWEAAVPKRQEAGEKWFIRGGSNAKKGAKGCEKIREQGMGNRRFQPSCLPPSHR